VIDDEGRRVHERVGPSEAILCSLEGLLLEGFVSFGGELAGRCPVGL
jgi:hypothetical protein